MTIQEHAERTETLLGHRAEDIHRWIDRYFDTEGFADFLRHGQRSGYNPYSHRKHRHCREALDDARKEFAGVYPEDIIDAVFERHIRDDYDGYFPYREDFENGTFHEKYHETDSRKLESGDLAEYFRGKHYEKAAEAARRRGVHFLWRFLLPVITALVLLVGSLFTVIVPISRENMLNLKKETIRELTAVAVGALEYYNGRSVEGLMSEEDAQLQASEEIRRMRYGSENKEYYWIIDSQAVMVMHPYQPELEGQDLSDYRDDKDTDGVYLFRKATRLALEDGDGYIEYWWQHWDDPGAKALKISYVRYFPEWDWIVGTGVYIEDVEKQLNKLIIRLDEMFGGIALVSILLLVWVLAGAFRVERRRDAAEGGLKESKERYRALAEASTEGYILIAGGSVLFVNPVLCRLLGRSEESLLTSGPLELLSDSMEVEHPARKALAALSRGEAPSGSWTVTVLKPDGSPQELQMGISRIFLPGSNGHVISFRRPITAGERIGMPDLPGICTDFTVDSPAGDIAEAVSLASNRIKVLVSARILGGRLTHLMDSGSPPAVLRQAVAEVYDACLSRFADLALEGLSPGIPLSKKDLAIISLGSNARREMTPFSDQDGALIFADREDVTADEMRNQCLILAAEVSSGLEKAGFPRCDGGVMPMNPRWCLSEKEWQQRITEWSEHTTPQTLLELNVALDRRHAWGNSNLSESLDESLGTIGKSSPGLVRMFRSNAMTYRPPSLKKSSRLIDIKEALKPLEIQLRLLSLRHGIRTAGTLERINALHAAGVLNDSSAADLALAFDTFWNLRFRKQMRGHRQPVRTDDSIMLANLSELEKSILAACLETVDAFIKRRALEEERK